MLSLYLWDQAIRNRCILFFADNESLVHVINKQSSKDKSLMFFVRKLILICLEYNIVFKAKHIAGAKNRLADSSYRLQVQYFKQFAPANMDKLPTENPYICSPRVGRANTHAV